MELQLQCRATGCHISYLHSFGRSFCENGGYTNSLITSKITLLFSLQTLQKFDLLLSLNTVSVSPCLYFNIKAYLRVLTFKRTSFGAGLLGLQISKCLYSTARNSMQASRSHHKIQPFQTCISCRFLSCNTIFEHFLASSASLCHRDHLIPLRRHPSPSFRNWSLCTPQISHHHPCSISIHLPRDPSPTTKLRRPPPKPWVGLVPITILVESRDSPFNWGHCRHRWAVICTMANLHKWIQIAVAKWHSEWKEKVKIEFLLDTRWYAPSFGEKGDHLICESIRHLRLRITRTPVVLSL